MCIRDRLHSPKYIQCAKLLSFPNLADKICKSLANKIKKNFKKIDLILAPAMGGVIIGYEIGKILKKETIFCERVNGKFTLRRGFSIKKGARVLIIEDVITTGKSSLECVKLIKKSNAKLIGFASIIDRSTKKSLKIKNKLVSKKKDKINLPHKLMHKRSFVLFPLFEIQKNWIHPSKQIDVKTLISLLPDRDISSIKQI